MRQIWLVHMIYCGIKLPTTLMVLDWIWYEGSVKILIMKSRIRQAVDLRMMLKSVEMGTHETGYWSDLSEGQIST